MTSCQRCLSPILLIVVACALVFSVQGEELPEVPATLTLHDVEQIALQRNPTFVQAQANVEASQGRALQAGLPPNPTLAYTGQQIGSEERAGQQGFYIDQLIVTGNKLGLNRAKFSSEAVQMQWHSVAHRYQVMNTVRMRYHEIVALQRSQKLYAELVRLAKETEQVVQQAMEGETTDRADWLEAKIQTKKLKSQSDDLQTKQQMAWRELAALIGEPNLVPMPLQDTLEMELAQLEWEPVRQHLLAESPELQIALAEVDRQRYGLRREQAEPIPNVQVRFGSQYDFASQDPQALAEVGMQLPLWDKNQGNIRTASAQLKRAHAEVQRVELALTKRLAEAMEVHETSRSSIKEYRDEMIPSAREAFKRRLSDLKEEKENAEWSKVRDSFELYMQLQNEYLNELITYRRADVAIRGLLLVDGLSSPAAPPSENRPQRDEQDRRLRENLQEPISGDDGRGVQKRIGNRPGL